MSRAYHYKNKWLWDLRIFIMGIPILLSDSEMGLCYFDDFFVIGSTESCHFDNSMNNNDMGNKFFINHMTFDI